MSNLLAIDSSTEACSVALLFNGQITHNFVVSLREHTKQILPMIDELLKKSDCRLSALDAIAFAQGPGSFTGIRIGIGVAQGLALGIDRPMIGISTLMTLAQGAYRVSRAKQVLSVIDARMAEVYLGAYQYIENGVWKPMIAECVIKPTDVLGNKVLSQLADVNIQNTFFAGTGVQTYPDMIKGISEAIKDSGHLLPDAQDILVIAEKQFAKGEVVSVENAKATYLRNEVTWQKQPK